MDVTFLGTGTPRHLERASAAIAVSWSGQEGSGGQGAGGAGAGGVGEGGGVVLLDAAGGNEVLRQLRAAGIPVAAVRHVVITHQHFDHMAGLPIFLLEASRYDLGPVWVYGPAEGMAAIRQVVDVQCPGINQRLGDRLEWVPLVPGQSVVLQGLTGPGGEVRLRATAAVHPVPAIGCVLEWGGRRLGYTGDTAAYAGIGEAYVGVHALIHEASGREGPNAAAMRAIGHSTGVDAGRTAAAAGTDHLVLTHFVPDREEGAAFLVEEARSAFGGKVTAAEDLLRLRV